MSADHINGEGQVRTRRIGDVVVMDVAGDLPGLGHRVQAQILNGLAEEPRAVVCDLTRVTGVDTPSLALLAATGQQALDWPGVPIALVSPDERVRRTLRDLPCGDQVVITAALGEAMSGVSTMVAPSHVSLDLEPLATAGRSARAFVSRTFDSWQVGDRVDAACLVMSELVTNGYLHAAAGHGLRASLGRSGQCLRVAVRDRTRAVPRQRVPDLQQPNGRGLVIVDALSRAWGVLPTADGGKVVWSVLDV